MFAGIAYLSLSFNQVTYVIGWHVLSHKSLVVVETGPCNLQHCSAYPSNQRLNIARYVTSLSSPTHHRRATPLLHRYPHRRIFSAIVQQQSSAAWMFSEPVGDVVDFPVQDDPAIVLLSVLEDLLARKARQLLLVAQAVRQIRRHRAKQVFSAVAIEHDLYTPQFPSHKKIRPARAWDERMGWYHRTHKLNNRKKKKVKNRISIREMIKRLRRYDNTMQ